MRVRTLAMTGALGVIGASGAPTDAACTPVVEVVSVSSTGQRANSHSGGAAVISADGRYVLFTSFATNLSPQDTNPAGDVYRFDRRTRQCVLVSVTPSGAAGNGASDAGAISADGRIAVFASYATDLAGAPLQGHRHLYARDMQTGVTTQLDVSATGVSGDNSVSASRMDVSDDGRHVAFASQAGNLVSGDTNGVNDVFVHDRQSGGTRRVSVDSTGTQGDYASLDPAISADGRYVAFASNSVLDVNVESGWQQIYRHDTANGETCHVSVSNPMVSPGYFSANQHCLWADISDDGQIVAFVTTASNLSALDTNGAADVYVRNVGTALSTLASDNSTGFSGNGPSGRSFVALSGDGRFVLFQSEASDLVGGAGGPNRTDWFLRSVGGTYAFATSGMAAIVQDSSGRPGLSRDGSVASFASPRADLVPGDANNANDVFVRGCPAAPAGALPGDVATGTIDDAADADDVSVSCLAGMKLALTLASADGALKEARVTVFGPDDAEIVSRTLRLTPRGAVLKTKIAATGDHVVRVEAADGTLGAYSLGTSAALPANARKLQKNLRGPAAPVVTFVAYAGGTLDATLTPKGQSLDLPVLLGAKPDGSKESSHADLGVVLRAPSGAVIDLTSYVADGGKHRTELTAVPLGETGTWSLSLGNLASDAHRARVALRLTQPVGSSDVPID